MVEVNIKIPIVTLVSVDVYKDFYGIKAEPFLNHYTSCITRQGTSCHMQITVTQIGQHFSAF